MIGGGWGEPAGLEDVVFDGTPPKVIVDPTGTLLGGAVSQRNLEGIEIYDLDGGGPRGDRLYFHAEEPFTPVGTRAMFSIGLAGGLWDGLSPVRQITGHSEAEAVGDGADELDFDPFSGLIFGVGPPTAYVFDELTPLFPPTPEPTTLALVLTMLFGVIPFSRRRSRR